MIAIVDYGAGNTESVRLALERLGVSATLTADPHALRAAERVILPGVGEARAAMMRLRETGLADLLPTLTQPVLGVCLGQQLLTTTSAERETECLGLLPVRTERFAPDLGLKVPHLGWNRLRELRGPLFDGVATGAWLYFVHSYYVPPGAYTTAVADYGLPFSAAVQFRNFCAVQFHPEKSGAAGARILQNFLTWAP
jgi:imidazole glycerol-phosphate synthase subunit HisH